MTKERTTTHILTGIENSLDRIADALEAIAEVLTDVKGTGSSILSREYHYIRTLNCGD